MTLDAWGRCCGRKPITYKRPHPDVACCPHRYCPRCYRAYNTIDGEQVENWAWKRVGGPTFKRKVTDNT